jgi:CubicO group peptidase (beta-lactamase class C family)
MSDLTRLVAGSCDARFKPVRDAFTDLLESDAETGAAVAVFLDGRLVVDLWGGTAHEGMAWQPTTVVNTYSVTKPFAAACLLKLVEQGRVDLDDRVERYWPEYSTNAKAPTTIRHILSHQAGVVAWSRPQPIEALLDWDRAASLCSDETPWWTPGEAHGEALFLYGQLVGEVVRRVAGRSLGAFLSEELCGPRSIDFHVGLTPDQEKRCATVIGMDRRWHSELLSHRTDHFLRAMANTPGVTDEAVVNSAAWRAAEIPAINGHGTARGVAAFYDQLLRADSATEALLAPSIVAEAVRPQRRSLDLVLGEMAAWGLGFMDFEDGSFGMGGLGGSVGLASRTRGYSFGYATRRMAGHERSDLVEKALISCLG